jgi:hypothetical protein
MVDAQTAYLLQRPALERTLLSRCGGLQSAYQRLLLNASAAAASIDRFAFFLP